MKTNQPHGDFYLPTLNTIGMGKVTFSWELFTLTGACTGRENRGKHGFLQTCLSVDWLVKRCYVYKSLNNKQEHLTMGIRHHILKSKNSYK